MGLLAAQTAVLAVLSWQVISLKTDLEQLSDIENIIIPRQADPNSPVIAHSQNVNLSSTSLTAIRTLVQDEIQLALDDLPAAQPQSTQSTSKASEKSEPEVRRIEQQIETKINTLTSLGSASRQDVDDVFYLIGQLPPERRQRPLRNLNRAINQGQINVRL